MHAFRPKAICSAFGVLLLLPIISPLVTDLVEPAAAPTAIDKCPPEPEVCLPAPHGEHPLDEQDVSVTSTSTANVTIVGFPPGGQPPANSMGWLPGFGHNHYASVAQTAPLYLFRGAADMPEMPHVEGDTTISVVGPVHLGEVALTAHVQGQVDASVQIQNN